MATHALLMKGLFQVGSRLRPMTGRTADPLVSLLKLALVEGIFSIFIDVMTILAGDPGFDMAIVREGNRRSSFFSKVLRMIQHDLVRLGPERGSGQDYQSSDSDDQKRAPYSFHACSPPEISLPHVTTNFPRRPRQVEDRHPEIGRCFEQRQSCWEHEPRSGNSNDRRAHSSSTRFP